MLRRLMMRLTWRGRSIFIRRWRRYFGNGAIEIRNRHALFSSLGSNPSAIRFS